MDIKDESLEFETSSSTDAEIEAMVIEAESATDPITPVSDASLDAEVEYLVAEVQKEETPFTFESYNSGNVAEEFLKAPEVNIPTVEEQQQPSETEEVPIIEFRNVNKLYDNGTKALTDVNLTINKGEFVFVVGASGAGKSTFMKLIIREEICNSGEIIVNGFKLNKMRRRKVPVLRRTMGIVYQDFRLIKNMTVFDNVAFAMHVVGASKKAIRKRVNYTLNLVGLRHKARSYPNELSGGEQQRVGLARAIVNNPSIIIADEPTGNVDPNMSYEIVELLSEINRRGTTVIMVTHEHQLVRDFNRRVIMIERGHVVADNAEVSGNEEAE